jgi:hypothetical protein
MGGAGAGTSTGPGGATSTPTGTSVGGGGPSSFCEDRFGSMTSYELCNETPQVCLFAVHPFGLSCAQICNQAGVDCDTAFEPPTGGSCNGVGEVVGCQLPRTSVTICRCLTSCNGFAACPVGNACTTAGCAPTTQ